MQPVAQLPLVHFFLCLVGIRAAPLPATQTEQVAPVALGMMALLVITVLLVSVVQEQTDMVLAQTEAPGTTVAALDNLAT